MKLFWRVLYCIWIAFLLILVLANVRLYRPTPLPHRNDQLPQTIEAQLSFCRKAINNGSAGRMQNLYPEGYVFSYLFFGIAWVDVGLRDESLREKSLDEAKWALEHVNDPESSAPFPDDLPPDHGMFYSAWRAHLLAGVVLLEEGANGETVIRLLERCDAIVNTLNDSSTPFPASYTDSSWPCDTFPGIHAMATYDHVTREERYSKFIANWIEQAEVGIDDQTGMFAHRTDARTGKPIATARATSQTIILRMLHDIDSELARRQYELYRENFYDTLIGLPSVREHPHGSSGSGDVDSGPLIFGRSLSATVMTIGIAQMYGDQEWADAIAQSGEVVGLPWTAGEQRFYAFGQMPIGDEMVAYSYTARPWFATEHQSSERQSISRFWRVPVHLISLGLVVLTLFSFWLRRKRLRKNTDIDSTSVEEQT